MPLYTPEITVNNTPLPVDGSGVTQPVSGTFWQATQPVSGTVGVTGSVAVTGTFWQATQPVSGTVTTTPQVSNTSAVTQITSTAVNQTLLAANGSRKLAILFFESGLWSVKLGAVASSLSLTYKITANNTTLEIPEVWQGQIDAICTTVGKLVDITELT